jgi:3-oxoacyl-[acyl-carrier-protein] synthase II
MEILGIGVVSPLGNGAGAFWQGLGRGHAPATAEHSVATPQGPRSLTLFESTDAGLERFVTRASLRRMDSFSRWALLAACLALEDAGLALGDEDKRRTGLALATGYGCQNATYAFLDEVIDHGDKCASPTHFANSVHNALASQTSLGLGIQGPCQTLSAFEQSPLHALWAARSWLESGAASRVLAGFGDESCGLLEYAIAATAQRPAAEGQRVLPWNEASSQVGTGFTVLLLGPDGSKPGAPRISCLKQLSDPPQQAFAKHRAVFLQAHGQRGPGSLHAAWAGLDNAIETRPLLGAMPTSQGFDIAAAALSLRHGQLRPAPRGSDALKAGDSLACLQADTDGGFHVACLHKD